MKAKELPDIDYTASHMNKTVNLPNLSKNPHYSANAGSRMTDDAVSGE